MALRLSELSTTRMHFSRMRTIHLYPGGVPAQEGVPVRGVYLPGGWGCTCPGGGVPAHRDVPAQGGVPVRGRGVPARGSVPAQWGTWG